MSHLLLAHLSKDKNGPRLVRALFAAHASGTEIVVASRFKETPVYQVRAGELPERPQPAPTGQLLLFCEDLVLLHPHRLLKLLPGYPSAGPSGSLSLWVTPCLIASI